MIGYREASLSLSITQKRKKTLQNNVPQCEIADFSSLSTHMIASKDSEKPEKSLYVGDKVQNPVIFRP